jgi:hypothetical protein
MMHFLTMAYPDSEDSPAECVALITLDENMASIILPAICQDVEQLAKKYDTDTLLLEMSDDCARFFDETELDMPDEFASLLPADEPISFHSLLYGEDPMELTLRQFDAFVKCVGVGNCELKEHEFRFLVARARGVMWEMGGTTHGEQHTGTIEWNRLPRLKSKTSS